MSQTFACLWFKQGSFAIVLFEKMSESFELVEGMEEMYFQADQVSIPESDDSAGRNQHYVESYVYETEEDMTQVLDPIRRWRLLKFQQLSSL